jgi:hypothetical protein
MNEQENLNESHSSNPQAGDYWNDRLTPVCVVLYVAENWVLFYHKHKAVDAQHWEWDRDEPMILTRTQFKEWLRYDLIPGYWADVTPGKFAELVGEFEHVEGV